MRSPSPTPFPPLARRNSRRERRTPNLKRGKYQREPKRRFILFCEGKNTEPAYFRAIERVCTSAQIEVQVEPAAGVPYTIAEKAVARAKSAGLAPRSRRVNSFEESDQVWAVFDRDEHPRFKEAVALCKHGSVNVAHSNPCFELWLLLHVQDHDRYEERSEIQRLLGKVRPDYVRDGGKAPDCDDLVTRLERAEQRAREQLTRREDSGDAFGNPSTTVGHLTYQIRQANRLASRPGK